MLNSRTPFTATQWQELEHQALIYKYMISGVPIPPELLYSVKRSLEPSLATRFFPNQPIGWGCYQVGFGRKPDPEPGRCRRTDGKKWRCSKEAYPDSKYCEKHMHRGKNRSRKPVEQQHHRQLGSSSANYTSILSSPSSTYSLSPLSSGGSLEPDHQNPGKLKNPFIYTNTHGYSQTSTTHKLFMDASSGSSSHADKDYRYYQGGREGMDERTFFPSYRGYPQSQFQCFGDAATNKPLDHQEENNHCFVLGTDFKSQINPIPIIKSKKDGGDVDDDTHKPIHHFFGDQWPPKSNSDSWLDLASTTTRIIHPDG